MLREVEVFGVTYERYVLFQLQASMTRTLGLKKIVDMPSHGAKAAGSLYSIGFGYSGCNVTLVNPETKMLKAWKQLGLEHRVNTLEDVDICNTEFDDNQFDLAFNFVTWTMVDDPFRYLREMKRISNRYVLLVTCNNFQLGYPWHRFLHAIFGFPWTHGRVEYNHITKVKKMLKQSGLEIVEYGTIDTPGWPDSIGLRDVRLHRKFGSQNAGPPKEEPDWIVPFLKYVKTGNYPGWMKALSRWDMAFRKGVFRLPISHLFYVLGEK